MKRIIKLIRAALIFVIWTVLFAFLSNQLIFLVWNFDFMSAHSWNILSTFWSQGGVIKTTSDVLLLMALFLLPFVWLTGFIFALRKNYLKLLTAPFRIFCCRKPAEPERIVIKNIKSSQQMIEEIKNEINSVKPEKSKKAGNIRSKIKQTLAQKPKK